MEWWGGTGWEGSGGGGRDYSIVREEGASEGERERGRRGQVRERGREGGRERERGRGKTLG